jgi:hypothetical protein
MSPDFFKAQMARLQTRFTPRAIDNEFVKLVWQACADMSEPGFQRMCDVFIGSRTASKPPLLSDFREGYLLEQKRHFENDVRGATSALKRQAPEDMRRHLRVVLSQEYGGVDSAKDALEIARIKQRTKGTP